jgi:hypothetical protein
MRRLLRRRRLRPQPQPRRLHLRQRRRLPPQPLPPPRLRLLRQRRRPPRLRRRRRSPRRQEAVRVWCGSIHRATSTTVMDRTITARPRPGLICLRRMQRPKAHVRITASLALSNDARNWNQDSASDARYGFQGRWLIKRIISRKRSPEIWRDLALILSSVSCAVWW